MSDWRARILTDFPPQAAPLTLVADPDRVLTDEGLLATLTERSFDVLSFDDPVAFRFLDESRYRSLRDRGQPQERAVILRTDAADLMHLPYDLWQAGHRLSLSLGELFPHLSSPIVSLLDRGDLDALYRAQEQLHPPVLGDDATKDVILTHVFRIDATQIGQPADALEILLRLHYHGLRRPAALDARLIHLLRQNPEVAEWPLEQIVPDREAFLGFLQERWPIFLARLAGTEPAGIVHEGGVGYGIRYAGPLGLPFAHTGARVYIDTLFLEGLLQPVRVSVQQAARLAGDWVTVGICATPAQDRERRLTGLRETLGKTIPGADARHQDWLITATRWAELLAAWHATDTHAATAHTATTRDSQVAALRARLDDAFLRWMQQRYRGLASQSPQPGPVMVHHIARVLARSIEPAPASSEATAPKKVALIVVDGLALDQWLALREVLSQQRPTLVFHDDACFAWIPTVTSVSRQAIFAGRMPLYYPASITTTSKEPALWNHLLAEPGTCARRGGLSQGIGPTREPG